MEMGNPVFEGTISEAWSCPTMNMIVHDHEHDRVHRASGHASGRRVGGGAVRPHLMDMLTGWLRVCRPVLIDQTDVHTV